VAKKRHRIGGARRKKSRKVRLLDDIRDLSSRAVQLRLKGQINHAMGQEDMRDRMIQQAEAHGFGEQASNAEEAGQRIGHRLFRGKRGISAR
jgi:hypothetical protein